MTALCTATTADIDSEGLIRRGQSWMNRAILSESAPIDALGGVTELTPLLLRDIVNIKTAAGEHTEASPTDGHHQVILYERNDAAIDEVSRELDAFDLPAHLIGEVLTQSLLVAAYTANDREEGVTLLSWLPSSTALRHCYFRPQTDNKPGPATVSTRRLLYHRELGDSSENVVPLWHNEILQTAPVAPLPPSALPSRMWPSIVRAHPVLPAHVMRTIPLISVISVAAMGHPGKARAQRRNFGLLVSDHQLDIALQSLWVDGEPAETYDFHLELHEHLQSRVPPIDYARRRALFPTPSVLYDQAAKYAMPARYVWQLLTGSDPFGTVGSSRRHGPLVANYLRFVAGLTDAQADALRAEAHRLLIHTGILDEPLLYTPLHDGKTFAFPDADTVDNLAINEIIMPGTHVLEMTASASDRSVKSLVTQALDGDNTLARALWAFGLTASGQHQATAARQYKIHPYSLANAEDLLERFLGRVLHNRGRRGNVRELTGIGKQLLEACLEEQERIALIAGKDLQPGP